MLQMRSERPHSVWMPCKARSFQEKFEQGSTFAKGRVLGCKYVDFNLVGESNEVQVIVKEIETRALLDTGSTVSTISQSFYNAHLPYIELQPLNDLLQIECADGNLLHYLGYVVVSLEMLALNAKANTTLCLLVLTASIIPQFQYYWAQTFLYTLCQNAVKRMGLDTYKKQICPVHCILHSDLFLCEKSNLQEMETKQP